MGAWEKCSDLMEPLEEYIPFDGKADTVGGEMARAISYIAYRFFNDGDNVGSFELYDNYGLGVPDVTTACAYLMRAYRSFGPLGRNIKSIVENLVYKDLSDSAYANCLVDLCETAREIFDNSPEVFEKRNSTNMYSYEEYAQRIVDKIYTPRSRSMW